MKNILRIEELAQFALGVLVFSQLDFAWWWFPLLILTPDISMLGYLAGNSLGAFSYNFFHHKALAIACAALGFYLQLPVLLLTGVILFSHSAMDRMFGYGLKFTSGFKDTHLGKIGQ